MPENIVRMSPSPDPGQLPTGNGTNFSTASAQMKLKKIAFARETISKQLQNCLTCRLQLSAAGFHLDLPDSDADADSQPVRCCQTV